MQQNPTTDEIQKRVRALFAAQCLKAAGQLIVGIVLGRILGPEAFGITGLIAVFNAFAVIFVTAGSGQCIVHRESLNSKFVSTVFWWCFAISVGSFLLILALGPIVERVTGVANISHLMVASAFAFPLIAFSVVPNSLLQRNFRLRESASIEVASISLGLTIGIVLATRGFGVWSLIWMNLAQHVVQSCLSVVVARWLPGLCIDFSYLRELLLYIRGAVGAAVVNGLTQNFDNFIVGTVLGSKSLGLYIRSYQFMLLPISQVNGIASAIVFPLLCRHQTDHRAFRLIYVDAVKIIAAISFPSMLGLCVTAKDFVLVVLGEEWLESVLLIQVFCIVGMQHSIDTTHGWILMAKAQATRLFRWAIIAFVLKAFCMFLGLRFGLVGVACGYWIATLVIAVPMYSSVYSIVNLPIQQVIRAIRGPLAGSVAMAILLCVLLFLLRSVSPAPRLVVCSITGSIFYASFLYILDRELIFKLASIVPPIIGRKI